MRTASACAGEAMTTVDAAEQTAATVSAARRAEDLLGNGIPPGIYVSAGTWVAPGTATTRGETVNGVNTCPPNFYARQFPARSGHLSRFRPCTASDGEMNRAPCGQIRLG
ncbi:hypothetical protein GCM10010254_35610 [Streptomyces chromofuscus]|nr:hypothetical protein GCM10010254_35610 [Streptomyces chromofuscus]